ncbi:hypothetical protein SAMD00019534_118560, partial [Acytostelium subglobosum LB1]|uniref:hypothetical protein n=1 Tax=Acytostelium subglobosum LB1 TaxID=1410327 RepID=UPI000644CEFC
MTTITTTSMEQPLLPQYIIDDILRTCWNIRISPRLLYRKAFGDALRMALVSRHCFDLISHKFHSVQLDITYENEEKLRSMLDRIVNRPLCVLKTIRRLRIFQHCLKTLVEVLLSNPDYSVPFQSLESLIVETRGIGNDYINQDAIVNFFAFTPKLASIQVIDVEPKRTIVTPYTKMFDALLKLPLVEFIFFSYNSAIHINAVEDYLSNEQGLLENISIPFYSESFKGEEIGPILSRKTHLRELSIKINSPVKLNGIIPITNLSINMSNIESNFSLISQVSTTLRHLRLSGMNVVGDATHPKYLQCVDQFKLDQLHTVELQGCNTRRIAPELIEAFLQSTRIRCLIYHTVDPAYMESTIISIPEIQTMCQTEQGYSTSNISKELVAVLIIRKI